jgi:putative hemolysin
MPYREEKYRRVMQANFTIIRTEKTMSDTSKVIDIEKVIRESKSKFVSSLPMFIIRFIQRVVHQDEMNECINTNSNKTGVPFVNDVLAYWNVKVVVNGGENVPSSGRFIFVANHPVGAMDALSFLSTIYRFFPNVISPSNQLLTYIPNLRPVMLGVNVFGINTKETVEKLNHLFESDAQIMIFPAGTVSRRSRGKISDVVWQKTFVTKAVQFKRDIIPVHISGRNSNLFYFVANLRKLLRIKMAIEIILLPRDMMKQRNSTVTMTIGEVIPYESLTRGVNQNEWAQRIKSAVYNIPGKHYKGI